MMWLRRVILVTPVVLLVFFSAAFMAVRYTAPRKLNQYVFGSIGEPDIINPILSTTSSASQVEARIFSGLVRFDENLELEGELAHSWSFTQNSMLFFETEGEAETALERLREHAEEWPAIELVDAERQTHTVLLRFDTAGTSYQEQLLGWLGDIRPLSFSLLQVMLDTEETFADGTTVSSNAVIARAKDKLAQDPDVARRVAYYWNQGTSGYLEMGIYGPTEPVVEAMTQLLATDDPDAPLGEVKGGEPAPVRDEPVIAFHLRKDVRWHDGAPFTAADVLFTYESLMDETVASPRRSSYEDVRKLEAPDAYTIRVTYKRPYSPALLSWMMGMIPKHILAGHDTRWWATEYSRKPIGTGPFILEKWKTNEEITLKRNPDYFEGAPHLDRVVIRFIPDMLALRLSFETGEIDILGVAPHALGAMRDNPDYEIFSNLSRGYTYVGWNLRRPMFQDKRVRHAVAHAINVPEIIKYLLYGQGVQSNGIFFPDHWWADRDLKPLEYDPERAKALLAEAGWVERDKDGCLVRNGERFEFTLITNQANEARKDIATLVQGDLDRLGIKVTIAIYEWAVFIKDIDALDFDACVLGWSLGNDYDQYQLWHSSQTDPGELNFVGYANPEADQLIEKIRSEFDRERIIEYCRRLQAIIYEDQPYVFLHTPMATTAMHKGAFRVRRPDGKGGWIDEPIRDTKAGIGVYNVWWYRPEHMKGQDPELEQ